MQLNEFGQPVGDPVSDCAPRRPPGPVHLPGHDVVVTDFTAEHLDGLWKSCCEPAQAPLWTYMSDGPFTEPAELALYCENLTRAAHPVAIVTPSGDVLGMAAYWNVAAANASIEPSIAWSKDATATPLGSPSPTTNGPLCEPRWKPGSTRTTSTPTVSSSTA